MQGKLLNLEQKLQIQIHEFGLVRSREANSKYRKVITDTRRNNYL